MICTSWKVETSTLLGSLVSMSYKGNGNIKDYVMEMSHLALKLKALKLKLFEDLLVHLVLISLSIHSINLRLVTNAKTRNRLLISSFHIVDKKKRDWSKKGFKVLIWLQLLRTITRRGKIRQKLWLCQHRKSNIRNRKKKSRDLLTIYMEVFLIKRNNIPNITLGM